MQVFTLKGMNLKFDLRTSSEEILGIYLRELLLKTLWMNKITERGYVWKVKFPKKGDNLSLFLGFCL